MGNYNLFRSKYYLIVSLQCLSAMPRRTSTNNQENETGGSMSLYELQGANDADLSSSSGFSSPAENQSESNFFDTDTPSDQGAPVSQGTEGTTAVTDAPAAEDDLKTSVPKPVPQSVDMASAGTGVMDALAAADGFKEASVPKPVPQSVDMASAGTGVMDALAAADGFKEASVPKPVHQSVDMAFAGTYVVDAPVATDEFKTKTASQPVGIDGVSAYVSAPKAAVDDTAEKIAEVASNKANLKNVELLKSYETTSKIALEADNDEEEVAAEVATGNTIPATTHVQSRSSNNCNESNSSIFTLGAMYSLPVASVDSMPIFVEGGVESDYGINGSAFVRSHIAVSNIQVGVHLGVAIKSEFWNYQNLRVTAIYSFDDILNNSLSFSIKSGLEVSMNGFLYWRMNLGYITFSLNLNNLYNSIKS